VDLGALLDTLLAANVAAGQAQLLTRLGPLDLPCRLHDGRDYQALRPRSTELIDGGLRVRVVDLETRIEIKSSTGRARDRLMLPVLLALRRERSGQT
jgi:hypothetical protein